MLKWVTDLPCVIFFLSGIDSFGVDAERKVILACMEGKSHKEDYPVSFRDSDTVTITKKPWRPRDGSIWVGFKLNNEGSEYEAFWETLKCAVVKIIEE